MTLAPLARDVFGVRFQNPILLASGTAGYGRELDGVMELDRLGGLVTKAVSLAAEGRATRLPGGGVSGRNAQLGRPRQPRPRARARGRDALAAARGSGRRGCWSTWSASRSRSTPRSSRASTTSTASPPTS